LGGEWKREGGEGVRGGRNIMGDRAHERWKDGGGEIETRYESFSCGI